MRVELLLKSHLKTLKLPTILQEPVWLFLSVLRTHLADRHHQPAF